MEAKKLCAKIAGACLRNKKLALAPTRTLLLKLLSDETGATPEVRAVCGAACGAQRERGKRGEWGRGLSAGALSLPRSCYDLHFRSAIFIHPGTSIPNTTPAQEISRVLMKLKTVQELLGGDQLETLWVEPAPETEVEQDLKDEIAVLKRQFAIAKANVCMIMA